MCDVKPEVKEDEKPKALLAQQKKEEKKDAAKGSSECCEPLCNPITCGP